MDKGLSRSTQTDLPKRTRVVRETSQSIRAPIWSG
jgi:hypothetical protein